MKIACDAPAENETRIDQPTAKPPIYSKAADRRMASLNAVLPHARIARVRESLRVRWYSDRHRFGGVLVNHRSHLPSCVTAGILLLSASASLHAHHSGAMYDAQKTDTLQGTVRTFQWSNPHCWIQLLVSRDGITQEWSVEMGSTAELYRSGWRPATVKAGDTVMIVVRPMRDGSPGAHFLSATGPGGAPLGKPKKTGNVP